MGEEVKILDNPHNGVILNVEVHLLDDLRHFFLSHCSEHETRFEI
jgi:hypothetical protein